MHPTNAENFIFKNRAMDTPLRGIHIPKFSKIAVKFSVLGVLYPYFCINTAEICHGAMDFQCQVSLQSVQHVAPVGRKTSKLPLSKLNTGTL